MIERGELPLLGCVAGRAIVGRGDVLWTLAARLYAVMASSTWLRCHRMIEFCHFPGADLVAIFACRAAFNVGLVFSGRNLAVVATETAGGNPGMIDLHDAPTASAVAVGTDVGRRWMVATFAGGGFAVMAGKASCGRALEFGTCMASLTADVDVFSGQWKASSGMIKVLVNHGLCRCTAARQQRNHQRGSDDAQNREKRRGQWQGLGQYYRYRREGVRVPVVIPILYISSSPALSRVLKIQPECRSLHALSLWTKEWIHSKSLVK